MKVAVIGAGWAGLSAAVALHRQGHRPVVFEASRTLGGRARGVLSAQWDATIDNGQHIMLGAYTDTLALMRELGIPIESRLLRLGLNLEAADGSFRLRAPALPAPLHLLAGILRAHGLDWTERLRLITLTRRLRNRQWQLPADLTVALWLRQGRQSPRAIRRFWQPLCLAALNTPVDQASASLLARVLRDSLGGPRSASDILLPRVDLSTLWAAPASARFEVRYGHAVRQLGSRPDGVAVEGEPFDAALIAANVPSAWRLLKQAGTAPGADAYLARLAAFRHVPIATVSLRLERPWRLPSPMLMLYDYPDKGQFGQWLFDQSQYMKPTGASHATLSIVISDAAALGAYAREAVVAGVIEQIRQQTRRFPAMPNVLSHELIVEKRATFAAVTGLERPDNTTPWPGVWVAGDWTDTGYPAVLEGAVRSGKRAAELIAASRRSEPQAARENTPAGPA